MKNIVAPSFLIQDSILSYWNLIICFYIYFMHSIIIFIILLLLISLEIYKILKNTDK